MFLPKIMQLPPRPVLKNIDCLRMGRHVVRTRRLFRNWYLVTLIETTRL